MVSDLAWCKEMLGGELPVEPEDKEGLVLSWKRSPRLWLRLAKKALRKGVLQETTAADARVWHRRVLQILKDNGATTTGFDDPAVLVQQYSCDCGRTFTTPQGLAAHRRFAHDYVAPETILVKGLTQCPACLRHLWTPARLRQHLSYIPRKGGPNKCYQALLQGGFRAEQVDAEDTKAHIFASTTGINRRDALRASGPLYPIFAVDASLNMRRRNNAWQKQRNPSINVSTSKKLDVSNAESNGNVSFQVHILSLDTAIDKVYGNLSCTSKSWEEVQKLLEAGRVAAGLAGSPCETFSAARYWQPEEVKDDEVQNTRRAKRWPRPLRDHARPWGLPGLSSKELKQLRQGSQFALQTLAVLAWILVAGGSFVSEHPFPPKDEWKVSVFRTPLAKLLLQIPEVNLGCF